MLREPISKPASARVAQGDQAPTEPQVIGFGEPEPRSWARGSQEHQHLARRQFRLLPYPPLVLVPHIGRLERISLRLHVEDQIDDVLEWQIMGVRPVPATPA